MKTVTKETIDNYVSNGWRPGGFVSAVLANDLMGALSSADLENRRDIFEICAYVYNNIPRNVHGSYEIVEKHLQSFRKKEDES
jgi:hypothetical protein